jgi:hypothetical protein
VKAKGRFTQGRKIRAATLRAIRKAKRTVASSQAMINRQRKRLR